MPKIFNKDYIELEIYESHLESWELSDDEEKKAVAINLRSDHRVTREREEKFREYITDFENLDEALDNYSRQNVKFTDKPHFCEDWCKNLVADCISGTCCDDFQDDIELATVISLNGLRLPLTDSYPDLINIIPEWREIIDIDTQMRFDSWLDNNLTGKSLDQIEKFINIIFKVINYRLLQEKKYYNPVWVTTWESLVGYVGADPDRWNQIVGVPRFKPTWQIVVKYSAKNVKCLHRPTQLDGSFYPQHFPSPQEAVMASGGHTMDLGETDDNLLSEYIHKQIELNIDYWINAGRIIGKTGITADKISEMRINHYKKLIDNYGEVNIKSWMPNPI